MKWTSTIFMVVCSVFQPAFAAVLTVGHDSGYDYHSITAAMAAAEAGDHIIVADGIYNSTHFQYPETFPVRMKPGITLKRAEKEIIPVIEADQSGSVIICDNLLANTCVIEGFRITGAGGTGHGISVKDASVKIKSCEINGNTSSFSGAGLSIWNGSAEIEDCVISENTSTGAGSNGGGITIFACDSVMIKGCSIFSNVAVLSGGGINVYDSNITIIDSMIDRNSADGPGGGIYFDWCTADRSILLDTSRIESNVSGASGGGICLTEMPASPLISYCRIEDNTAAENGAGLHIVGVDTNILCSTISGNESQLWGGGAYIGSAMAYLVNCMFYDNTAFWGGGFSATESEMVMFNVLIYGNEAVQYGGAVFAQQGLLQVYHGTFEGNSAGSTGGALLFDSLELMLQSSIVWNNSEPVIFETSSSVQIEYTHIQGNYPGTGNSDEDPIFALNMFCGGRHYLSQVASGETEDSPCVDTGKVPSDSPFFVGDYIFRLCDASTRTDRSFDTGMSDRGFHYYQDPSECNYTGCAILMPAASFGAGDICYCDVVICNSESDTIQNVPVFVLLEVAGLLFFAPEFDDFAYYSMKIYPGIQFVHVVPRFTWPANAGSFSGAYWYAAMTNPEITAIVGLFDSFEFGWH